MLTSPVWRTRVQLKILVSFAAGCMLGAVGSGLLLWVASGLVQPVPREARVAVLIALTVGTLLIDLAGRADVLPQSKRQIPIEVFTRPPAGAGFRFGTEYGSGLRTYLPTATAHLLALSIVLLMPGPRAAIVAGVGFGLGRAAMPIARAVDGTRDRWDAKLERCLPRIRAVVAVAGTFAVATLAHGTVS